MTGFVTAPRIAISGALVVADYRVTARPQTGNHPPKTALLAFPLALLLAAGRVSVSITWRRNYPFGIMKVACGAKTGLQSRNHPDPIYRKDLRRSDPKEFTDALPMTSRDVSQNQPSKSMKDLRTATVWVVGETEENENECGATTESCSDGGRPSHAAPSGLERGLENALAHGWHPARDAQLSREGGIPDEIILKGSLHRAIFAEKAPPILARSSGDRISLR